MSILQRVQHILGDFTEADVPGEQSLLSEDLSIDSLALVDIRLQIEEYFNILIEDEVMADFRTVGDIVQSVEYKLKIRS